MRTLLMRAALCLLSLTLLMASAWPAARGESDPYQEQLDRMSLEEKVCQMFVVEPTSIIKKDYLYTLGSATRKALARYPVGGFIYFPRNLPGRDALKQGIAYYQQVMADLGAPPLIICADEEGGSITRVVKRYGQMDFPAPQAIGTQGAEAARQAGLEAGAVMKALGFNLNLAPALDLTDGTGPLGSRSYGSRPAQVIPPAGAFVKALQEQGIAATAKHFPGMGSAGKDTHQGLANNDRTLEQLQSHELLPFVALMEEGIPLIMVGHVTYTALDPERPASLSPVIVKDLLREHMGYEGLIITDALGMKAVTGDYSSGEAAVMAIQAGHDLLLMPAHFKNALKGVLEAVTKGEIAESRIDESVLRILRFKDSFLAHETGLMFSEQPYTKHTS